LQQLIAFSSDVNHGSDDLFFDKERVEAEVRELLGEVMLRDGNHAKLGYCPAWCFRRECQVCLNHIFKLILRFLHGLVNDNPVHSAAEVKIDLLQDTGGIDSVTSVLVFLATSHSFFQEASSQSHLNDSMLLLRVQLRQLECGHVINEEVVSNLTISEYALLMSLSHSLGEDSRILCVEEKVYSCELAIFLSFIIPATGENVTFSFI
jgi:hypothetical protein